MCIDAGITGCAGQVLVLTIRNVKVCLWVSVFLGQAKIYDIDLIASLANAHQEVVWLDVSVDERFGVDVFDS